jgi:two-component system nitrate/nitrite response regulator NarL
MVLRSTPGGVLNSREARTSHEFIEPTATTDIEERRSTIARLLICGDHWIFVEALAAVLGGAGYEVVATTRTLGEALTVIRRRPVDVCMVYTGAAPLRRLDRLADLRRAARRTAVVVIADADGRPAETAAPSDGVHAVVHMSDSMADVIEVLAGLRDAGPAGTGSGRSATPGPPARALQLAGDRSRPGGSPP